MITHIDIKNFRGLRSVQADLKPLTVLIGANDTGKSAFLAALQYWATGTRFQPADYWRSNVKNEIGLIGHRVVENGRMVRDVWIEHTSQLASVGFFQLPSKGAAMLDSGQADEQGALPLQPDGGGVPKLVDYLLRRDRKRFFKLVAALSQLVPGLNDIEVATPSAEARRLDLVIEDGFRIPADQASAGIRFLLFFLALAYHPSPPQLILLEEPETGIHPKRLADVLNLLRDITQGKHGGHAAQVVLTTHSPYLLDLVNLETDQVLVFRREDDGSRTCEAADAERLKLFLDEFMLGEVWYNQGEEGLVARPS